MVFVKGQSGNPKGKKKGTLNKDTLTKLERRAIFEEKVSQKWDKIIEQLRAEYVADQFMGKAPDKVEHSGEIKNNNDVDIKELAKKMAQELKKKL